MTDISSIQKTVTPKDYLYSSLPKFKKSRFYVRLADSILQNQSEFILVWGAKGLGKSTLCSTILKNIYGSWDEARKFKIQRRDEIPRLVEMVQNDSRYHIDYNGIKLKRIWALNWDDCAVDLPSSESNKEDFVAFHRYFMTIRSHVGIIIASAPDWYDFRKRMRVGFTGEIALQWKTMRLPNGNVVKRRKGEMLWFRNRPDYYKNHSMLEGKEHAIPITWKNLPSSELEREIQERTHLADRLLHGVRQSLRQNARVLVGLSGDQSKHLLEWEKELLGTIWESVKHRPLKLGNIKHINDQYFKWYKMKFDYKQLKDYLTILDSKQLIQYRQNDKNWGQVGMTDLGEEVMRLIKEQNMNDEND